MANSGTPKALHCSAKHFTINTTNFSPHYSIISSDGDQFRAVLGLQRQERWKLDPLISLHEGLDEKSPVSALSYMPFDTHTAHVGVVVLQSRFVTWNDLVGTSGSKWNMTVSTRDQSSKSLTWKHTRSSVADGMKISPMSRRNLKLKEHGKHDKPVAVFTSNRGFKTCGTLQINEDYGQESEILVLMTCLAIRESARRRFHRTYYDFS